MIRNRWLQHACGVKAAACGDTGLAERACGIGGALTYGRLLPCATPPEVVVKAGSADLRCGLPCPRVD